MKSAEISPPNALSIAQAFLRQSYPLSKPGQGFAQEVQRVVDSQDREALINLVPDLPTVEDPHPDYFRDLRFRSLDRDAVFGIDLSVIQTTKGCSHQCGFCAADSSPEVQVMPYPAVIKIGQEKLGFELEVTELYQGWQASLEDELRNESPDQNSLRDFLRNVYRRHPLSSLLPPQAYYSGYPRINVDPFNEVIVNFWDSDPLDYVDPDFPHQDGTPADYGDVVNLLASTERPINISTAGWSQKNQIAQRAAAKLVKLHEKRAGSIGAVSVSITKTEPRARRDPAAYCEDMKMVVLAFAPLRPQVKIFIDENEGEFAAGVVNPLKSFLTRDDFYFLPQIRNLHVSYYSGRARTSRPRTAFVFPENNFDTGACAPGYHLRPNGEVDHQDYFLKREDERDYVSKSKTVLEGTRPRLVGWIFQLPR